MEEAYLIRLLFNGGWILAVLGVIAFLLTFIVKRPIKKLTAVISVKLAENKQLTEVKRNKVLKLLNKVVLLLPFIIGFALIFAYSLIFKVSYTYTAMFESSINIGIIAIFIYALLEKAIDVINDYNSPEGQQVLELAKQLKAADDISDKTNALTNYIEEDIDIEKISRLISKWCKKPPDLIKKVLENLKK